MSETATLESVDVAGNLARVQARIAAAVRTAGAAQAVDLIAVSKTHDAARIRPALEAGHRDFGENRVQEAVAKWPALKAAFPHTRLHLIGPLQTNKLKPALELFDVIHTVDREKLARKLADALAAGARLQACYVEVNTGGEPQKAGIAPAETDAFVALCRDRLKLPVVGLMCIPPLDEEPSPHFALLRKLAQRNGLAKLSMGMSADYETAIAFGATAVRVGTAIFGPREPYPRG